MKFLFQPHLDQIIDVYEHEEEEFEGNACSNAVAFIQNKIKELYQKYKAIIWYSIYITLLLGYYAYFGWCMYDLTRKGLIGKEESIRLIGVTVLLTLGVGLTVLFNITKPNTN